MVVADQRSPRDGRFIELIGSYNPQTNPSTIAIDRERLEHWLSRGAQPSATVKQLVKALAKSGGPAASATEEPAVDEDGAASGASDEPSASADEESPAGSADEAPAPAT